VWDQQFEKMIDPDYIFICAATGRAKGKIGGEGYVEEWVLMQYTGLKDLNGVEIYEGDVVKVYDEEFDNTFIGEVKFGFRWTPAFEIYDKDDCTYCDEYLTLSNFDLQFTVIGNVYQNPELLEGN
jgi:uncharacterized phage protein (TIGR01671 family)